MRILLVLVFIAGVSSKSFRRATLVAGCAWPLSDAITNVFKWNGRMLRPNVELHDVVTRIEPMTSYGTASAHSANMAAIATALWLVLGWRWGLAWSVIALLTGLSRIYNGVHYPSQVMLGWTVGIFVGWLMTHTFNAGARVFGKRSPTEPAADPSDQDSPESPAGPPQS